LARVGDVLWLYDDTAARERKRRMFVCLDPERGWFARIVSDPPRHAKSDDYVPVMRADHAFLDHDSFVETGREVDFGEDEFESIRPVGRISASCARRNIDAWQKSRVAPVEVRDVVVARLTSEFGIE
jgi:hypothetical protein